jgi:hypothetical protein
MVHLTSEIQLFAVVISRYKKLHNCRFYAFPKGVTVKKIFSSENSFSERNAALAVLLLYYISPFSPLAFQALPKQNQYI